MDPHVRAPALLLAVSLLFVQPGCVDSSERLATSAIPGPSAQPDTSGWPDSFGYGRPASPEEIAAWDIDVMADGTGLPPGSGTVERGAAVYAQQCAACHGATGIEGPAVALVGRFADDAFPFGDELGHPKTIGNYWPYAPTVFDYIRRAMPYGRPGALSDDEVYSLTAFLLHRNEIIPEDAVMDATTLPAVKMPARDRFVPDDRLQFHVVR